MIALGCLSLVILPLAGLAIGTLLAGTEGATLGGIAGFAIALVIAGTMAYALVKVGRRD